MEGFKGPVCQVPKVMAREGGVLAPGTRLQHLGDSEVLLKKERRSDARVSLALGGGPGKGLLESWYA